MSASDPRPPSPAIEPAVELASLAALDRSLRSARFREEREADWLALLALVEKAEKRSPRALSDEEILAAPSLHRSALSSLSIARAISLDGALIAWLESLCARSHFFVHGPRATLSERLAAFFGEGWPSAAKAIGRETLIAALTIALGAVVGWLLVAHDPDWFSTFVDPGLASGRDPDASAEALRATLYHEDGARGLGVFATYLFTHNAQIALLAFALGFAFGAPTFAVLAMNGAMLGALLQVFFAKGLGFAFVGWLSIHGVTELLAIAIAGGAGLSLGRAAAFPGDRTRIAALAQAGRTAGAAMAGVVAMLLIAGLLEGFGRQLVNDDWARYAVAGLTAVVWGLYLYAPRREAGGRGRR